ncbi:MAG: hypothetical protein VKJ06_07700 [Vampirovibrionales bacterium]|nr:hypothetical protein [Vampirovibrionales bacterium]
MTLPIKLGILGAGGLGKSMARMALARGGYHLVAMADSHGFCADLTGLDAEQIQTLKTVADYPQVGQRVSQDPVLAMLKAVGSDLDALFIALPNLPVTFYAETVTRIAQETPFSGIMVDALKRTKAVQELLPLDGLLRSRRILYITGAGATPGFLTTMAAVAAQSFVRVKAVDIRFGVGVSNWESYRATIREDFLHLPGFDAARVAAMSDADIEAELEARNGLIELENMEHADDIILAMAGVCPPEAITVGGVVDTRNARKPVSTQVTVTGETLAGITCSHVFTVADDATMADNVCGPAVGFMNRAVDLHARGFYGLSTSAELMPKTGPSLWVQNATQKLSAPAMAMV